MGRKKSYRVVLDTETCPVDKEFNGVDPFNMFVYDIGWAIVDRDGNVYRTRSYINADIFLGEKDLMKSAFYAKKIPMYWEDIKAGTRTMTSLYNIRKILLEDMTEFECTEIFAHNCRFDRDSLNNTQRWETKSKYRYFLPKGIVYHDTMDMAKQVVATMPTYKKWCAENGFMTKRNQPQTKAETLYRFITKDINFEESHTGLEDVLIEKEIMAYCYRKHKKLNMRCY